MGFYKSRFGVKFWLDEILKFMAHYWNQIRTILLGIIFQWALSIFWVGGEFSFHIYQVSFAMTLDPLETGHW